MGPPDGFSFPDELAAAGDSATGSQLHFEARHHDTSTSSRHPWALGGGVGTLLLYTDIELEFAAESDVTFVLEETSGRYLGALRPERDGVSDDGYALLRFTSLPDDGVYRLTLIDHRGAHQRLFDDVPYAALHEVGNDHDDEIVDPLTLEEVEV